MAFSKWSNVQVAIGTLGTAVPINTLSKANPGLVEYTGTDPATGDYVALTSILGMVQVNNRIFRVGNEDTVGDDFELESEDTTLYDTFVSGNFQPVTFGTSLSVAAGVAVSGGDFAFLDTTTIHDTQQTQIPGLAAATAFTFDCFWDPSDAGLAALVAASNAQAQRALRLTFANAYKYLLLGYVGATLSPTGNAQEMVKTSVVFTAFGRSKTYTT